MRKHENIKKWIDLDILPKKYGVGVNANKLIIDWFNSIGCKMKFIYDDIKDELEIINIYNKNNQIYATIKYENRTDDINCSSLKNCCIGKILLKVTKEYRYNIGEHMQRNNLDIIITDRKIINNLKMYKYYCNKCSFDCGEHWSIKDKEYKEELWISEYNLQKKLECNCCSSHKPNVVVKEINSIYKTNNDCVQWFKNIEDSYTHTSNSTDIVTFQCIYCKTEKDLAIYAFNNNCFRFSCPECGDGISYPNKFMYNLLKQLNIDFKTEYSPNYLNGKHSDFYIPSMNLIIEMDGKLGHKDGIMHSKSKITLEESIKIDEWKTKQHLNNNIKTIRINSFESDLQYIKSNILNSKLNTLFNLSKIDWDKIDEYCTKTLIKEVCEYWKMHNDINNEELTTNNLATFFNISTGTIVRYLCKGKEYKWCNYDPSKEMNKCLEKGRQGKQVEIFKEGKSLGIFKNCHELDKQSEKLFGVHLDYSNICAVCRGTRKSHKGYAFKYV